MLGDERLLRRIDAKPCRILIVDDDASLRETMLRLLPGSVGIVDPGDELVLMKSPSCGMTCAADSLVRYFAAHARMLDTLVVPSFERIAAEWAMPPYLTEPPRARIIHHYQRAHKRTRRRKFNLLVKRWFGSIGRGVYRAR